MGKRSRSKARKDVLAEESASENSSKQTSPIPSDSEEEAPPPKKAKSENGGKRTPKSSADICEKHGLTDVELEYTVADYQNLTNYGLFVRMVRPQVAAANPKITSSRMVQIMEAKWREFKESNPLVKKKPEQEQAKKAESEKKSSSKKKKDKKHKESHKKERKHERKSSKRSRKVQSSEEEEEEEKDDDATEEEEEEEEVEEEPTPPKRPSIGLKIKLPLNTPKSSSAKKSKKDRRSGSSRRRIEDSDEEESRSSSKRSSRVATPISRQSESRRIEDSDEEESRSSSKRSSRVATPIYRQSDSNAEATSPEEEADSEDETPSRRGRTQPKRRSKSGRKVVQQDPSTEEEDEEEEEEEEDAGSDDDFTTPKPRSSKSKSRQRKPKEPEDKDFETDEEDPEEEEEDEEDDEDMDTDEERSKRKKRKSEPPVIPGERKSERKRKTLSDQLLSDKEFEKILKEEALEKRRKKDRERRAKKRQQKDKFKVKGKKGYWQQEEEEEEKEKEGSAKEDIDESDDHYWYCEACKDGGDLLLCDTCPKSWHKDCAKIEGEIPEGDWSCPKCKGTYESEEEDHHDLYCKECKDGGDVLLCDFCKFVYHPKCTNPPLLEIPDGEWKCPRCVIAGQELKAKMKRVLFWRWSHQLSGTDELDHTQSPQKKAAAQAAEVEQKEKEAQGATPVKRPERLFFCKFEYHSFWDCEWLTELQLEVHCPLQYAILKRKWDLDEAPALEDGSSWGRQRRKTRDEEDPHNLEERYYRYGVKPAWLQIHRIITHDSGKEGGKNTRYLVKWRDLGYEDCTWELPSMLPAGLEDWDKYYKAYWDHRKKRMKPPVEKKKKKSDLKKKWEKQPDYIDSTGGKLHPYQLEGVNWMRFSWAQDTNIILADEMGLGKTIQAITILYTLWKEGYCKGPFLISAPLSTVPNWEREFEFWAPDMYVLTYAGHKEARAVIREHEFTYEDDAFHQLAKAGKMRSGARPKFDVLLTSYEMVNVDSTTLQSISWEILVVDEAHRLKSQASLFFQTLSKYKINFKLLLTGTPLQNNLEELFNLLNFLEPKTFTDMDNFLDEFSDINKDEQVRKLHEMLAPHMLRRLKLDVLTDLPTKSEFIVRIELAPMQKKFYKHILTKNYEALNVKGYANSTSLINIMMDLRKCCNHPYLFPAAEKEAPLTMNGLYEGNGLIKACGKLELLTKMLKELKKQNHRVLIFSQMTRALDILEDFLTHEGYGYERIDGSITGKLRQESIDRFNDKESSSFVFLLSTKAGGLGINLATADTVIIYDMDWNPHNDIQALSRAHRIGQQNRVLIYRFVSRNTVEERITEVAKKKMMLTELVIHRGMGSEKQESLSKKEVSDILKFGAEDLFKDTEEGNVVWTDEAVNKLLDRNQESETPETTEKEAVMGMNEYLRSFKVASYHVKEGQEEAEKEEEEEEEKEEERKDEEPDEEYWRRVLGKTYQEHRLQIMQQEEAVARSLGKGKRVRRQVNYAEVIHTSNSNREAAEKEALAKAKGKRPTEEAEDEPEDMVEEETKYMSDYEPDEEESSEEEEEEEPEEEGPPSDNQDDDWVGPKKPQEKKEPPTKKRGRPSKALKPVSTELPPLLAKVNGHTEVLGFTARQRRAFLDAVMRYGMPPEDGHQSQWLVRDLRNKSERVFRAYVSLFMRHLCEPVSDDAEKFSDGVPREGLSRQHVLTRIGIIALIRRKVQEFEENNGTDSMSAFRRKTAKTNTIVIDASQLKTPEKTEPKEAETGKEDKDKEVKVENGKQEEEKKDVKDEKDKKEDVKEEVKEEKTGKDEKVKDEVKEEDKEKGESEKEKKKERDEGKEEKDSGEDDKEEEEDEKMEVDDDDEEEDEDSEEEEMRKEEEEEAKKGDIPQVDGAGDDKESSSEKDKSEEKEEEAAKGEEKKKEKQKEEEEMETDEKEREKVKGKNDSEDESEEKEEKKEKEEAKSDKKKTEEKDGKDSDIEDLGSDQEDVPEKGKTKTTEEKGEGSKEKTKGEESAKGEEKKSTEEKAKTEEKKSSEGKKDDSAKSTTPSKPDEKSEKEKEKMKIVVDLRKQAWELRRIFYIADGGFTELHALWQYEEQQLKPGREYETWHRRHDYWLLAGIITHGYRHWQDILNDPRFEMLNRAFQSDAEKMRKAAFLNRRFQLLEQALVIEEQLHKAVLQSADLRATLRKNCRGDIDAYAELDQLAILLRQIARRGATQDAHLARVLAQLESLVGDIKHSTNSVVPATLARAPGVVIRQSGQHGPSPVGRPRVNPGGMRPVQQVVIPRHLMDQRRNTPSPNSKNPTVITLE